MIQSPQRNNVTEPYSCDRIVEGQYYNSAIGLWTHHERPHRQSASYYHLRYGTSASEQVKRFAANAIVSPDHSSPSHRLSSLSTWILVVCQAPCMQWSAHDHQRAVRLFLTLPCCHRSTHHGKNLLNRRASPLSTS